MTASTTVLAGLTPPDTSPVALARVTSDLAALAAGHDRTGDIPWEGLQIVHRAGYLTATVDPRYGGPGLSTDDVARIVAALGQGDPSVALIVANTLHTHRAQAHHASWPDDIYREIIARSALEPTPVNTIRAEPELGAPARGGIPATVAQRTEDGWLVSGRKAYATGGEALAYHVVWVVTDEPEPRVGHLLIDGDAPGITWVPTWDHLGLRASNTHDVVYDETPARFEAFTEIPRGEDGIYRDPASNPTSLDTLWHAALYLGLARAARESFARYARERVPTALGAPIATTERIQSVAGQIELQIVQAEALLFGTLARAEAGESEEVTAGLGLIKTAVAQSVVAAASLAVETLGNPGLSRRNDLERHLRDALCVRVHPPQADTAYLAAGRRVLGQ